MSNIYQIAPAMVHSYATTDDVHAVVDFLRRRGHSIAANFMVGADNSDFIHNHPAEYASIQADWSEAINYAARKNRWNKE